ncbi:TonB-dependent receptor plug domain-containing protein [Desulfomarina sp.]
MNLRAHYLLKISPQLVSVLLCGFGLLSHGPGRVVAATGDDSLDYLKGLNIEDLLRTQVTSASKRPESLTDTATAVFVITAEDIKRTGARNIPEALRMVPGIQVSQLDSNKWIISARGFGELFSNKLLVLMDGRSVYTPLFSGVFWDVQDTVMEDIDRIEVIRGPGATLWGANAVNGVINIITKSTSETMGGLVSLEGGSYDPLIATARYGGAIGKTGGYRFYMKGAEHNEFPLEDGTDGKDDWDMMQGGFRVDLEPERERRIRVQGDIQRGNEGVAYSFPGFPGQENLDTDFNTFTGNLLTRWEGDFSNGNLVSLQAYWDYTEKDLLIVEEKRTTFDLDFQYVWTASSYHDVVWGLGYRVSSDEITSTQYTYFNPGERTDELFSAFIQDEIILVDNRWWLTVGSKFEHNDYSGFEVQPNMRMRWKTSNDQTFWTSVSRAVRTPARADHDMTIFTVASLDSSGNLVASTIEGNHDFEAEELVAYEAGHRCRPFRRLSLDTAVFYNVYENLRSLEVGAPYFSTFSDSLLLVPNYITNALSGKAYGLELLATLQAADWWKLAFGYSLLKMSFDADPDIRITSRKFIQDDYPQHMVQVRSYMDVWENVSLDSEFYYMDELGNQPVDAYIRFDLRLGWEINKNFDLSLNIENLTDSRHREYASITNITGTEVPRRFFAKLTWNY